MNRRRPISALLRITLLALSAPATLAAQNLLENPEFDGFTTTFPGWSSAHVSETEGVDADACPDSRSFYIDQPSSIYTFVNSATCVPVATNDTLYLELTYRSEVGVHVRVAEFNDSNCTVADIVELGIAHEASLDWTTARATKVITDLDTVAVRFQPVAVEAEEYEALFDRAYLGFAERVFADDFDGGTLCRWDNFDDGSHT